VGFVYTVFCVGNGPKHWYKGALLTYDFCLIRQEKIPGLKVPELLLKINIFERFKCR